MRDRDFEKLEEASRLMRERIDEFVVRYNLKVKIRGPMPAVISRIQRFHRVQIIVQSPGVQEIQKLFAKLRGMGPVRPAVRVAVDIDPVNLL
jgi:primosomal protein N'